MKLLRTITGKGLICLVCVLVFSSVTPASAASSTGKKEFKRTAAQIVKDMGNGWNLGNSFDCTTSQSNNILNEKRDQYYSILSYSSNPYSDWDASEQLQFDSKTGELTFNWVMNSIKSNPYYAFGGFGIQIFNWAIGNTGDSVLKIKVSDASLTLANGTKYVLDSMIGTFESKMTGSAAKFYPGKFTQLYGLSTGDLKGATLHVRINIVSYLQPANATSQTQICETMLNPLTTKELIQTVADAGFGTVRIPVSYVGHFDSSGTIDIEWLNRIEEVVNYCLDNNMYCIINMHHDGYAGGWIQAESTMDYRLYEKLWTQISEHFKSYGEKLIFEGYNEVLDGNGSWSYPGMSKGQYINKLAQVFVDTVRATGGNNAKRYLMVPTYGAMNTEQVLNDFAVPKDTVKDHIIVDVHLYMHADFCWYQDEVSFATVRSSWGTDKDYTQLDSIFTALKNFSKAKNVPVVIGEFGCWDKNNTKERNEYINNYVKEAAGNGIACCWWDTGYTQFTQNQYKAGALIDRKNNTILFPELVKVIAQR